MAYSYSTDEENFNGTFDTIEEACEEAAADVLMHGEPGNTGYFWVGEIVPPAQPETYWYAEDWLECVSCDDEYGGEWADGWDESTDAQQKELEEEVRKVLSAWLDRHDLRPKFFNIGKVVMYHATVKADGGFELEEEPAKARK
jgi:hypothetical protein